jgi:hypothetical protein
MPKDHDQTTATWLWHIEHNLRDVEPHERQGLINEAVRRHRLRDDEKHRRHENAIRSLMTTIRQIEDRPGAGLLTILRRAARAIRQRKEEACQHPR